MPDERPIYLDCNATTPIDPRVREVMLEYIDREFGNAGSRTHIYGQEAARGVKRAREQIAAVVDAAPEEVIFTSGATEANNLAILGLAEYGQRTGKKHVISTQIEHKAVLEPLQVLESWGFEVELVPPTESGYVEAEEIGRRLRDDTLLVSVMHVNNETGVIQPLHELCQRLAHHDTYFHTDAAQGFGKHIEYLRNPRIDLLSISAHKIHGPVGVGSLIARRTRQAPRALTSRQLGGGQERGLRAGTLPTFLICGFGEAAARALDNNQTRTQLWREVHDQFLEALSQIPSTIHGAADRRLPTTINFSIADIDAELVILALRDVAALATGSACTSATIEPSHVLSAMYPSAPYSHTACRASWSFMTPTPLPVDHIHNLLSPLVD